MNGKLRIVIARLETTPFAPEILAESVGVDQLISTNSDAIERVQETEFGKFLDRVWECVHADAEFTNAATARIPRTRCRRRAGSAPSKPADTPSND